MSRVSIIIPVYNVEKYLKTCLDSFINQTFKDIEIICVNDGSTDSSGQILEKYAQEDKRITIINQDNSGIADARNSGLDIATGEYIMFADSDDYVDPHFVEYPLNHIELTDSDIVIFGVNCICKDKIIPREDVDLLNNIVQDNKFEKKDLQCFQNYVYDKIYRKSFLNIHNIHFLNNAKTAEDGIFNLMCYYRSPKYAAIPDLLYYYRVDRENSATKNGLKGISTDMEAYGTLFQTEEFKNAVVEDKEFSLCKALWGITYFESKLNNFVEKVEFCKILEQYLQLIDNTFPKELQNSNINKLNEVKNITIANYITNYFIYIMDKLHIDYYALKNNPVKYIIQNIFSVTNSNNKTHKVITVLGIKIKFKI